MIHDPCMFPQLRSKKREQDDWFLVRMGCFNGDNEGGDASDVEAGRQGMGPAASGPQRSLGAKSDVADYSKDDSDRRVQNTGSTTNVNIDRSQPSVLTDRGRVYGTQANLDRAVERGDINITPSPIDSYTPGTSEAISAFTTAGGIMPGEQAAAGPALVDLLDDADDPTPITITSPQDLQTNIDAFGVNRLRAVSPGVGVTAATIGDEAAQQKRADLASVVAGQVDENVFAPSGTVNIPTSGTVTAESNTRRAEALNKQAGSRFKYDINRARQAREELEVPPEQAEREIAFEIEQVEKKRAQAMEDVQNIDRNLQLMSDTLARNRALASDPFIGRTDFDEESRREESPLFSPSVIDPVAEAEPGRILEKEKADRAAFNQRVDQLPAGPEVPDAAFTGQEGRQRTSLDTAQSLAADQEFNQMVSELPPAADVPDVAFTAGPLALQRTSPDTAQSLAEAAADREFSQRQLDNFIDPQSLSPEGVFPPAAVDPDPESIGALTGTQLRAALEAETLQGLTPQQQGIASSLRDLGISDSAIRAGIAPEGTLPGDEQRGLFFADLETAATERPLVKNPFEGTLFGIAGQIGADVVNTFTRPDAKVEEIIRRGGQPILDENGFIVGAFDTNTQRVMARSGEMFNPALKPFYDKQRAAEAQERESRGENDEPMLSAEDLPLQEDAPEVVEGRNIVTSPGYQPRGPLSIAYTGLPSLAPTVLRPTYTPQTTFSPLFPLGQRRSR
mgnify:CR=1 FL=1